MRNPHLPLSLSSSSSSSLPADFPLKVVEERVFIEILDKRKEVDGKEDVNEGKDKERPDGQPDDEGRDEAFDDSLADPSSLEITPDLNDDEATPLESAPSTSIYKRRRFQGRLHQKSDKSSEETTDDNNNGLKVPLPWIACCLCVLCLQLIVLLRYYFSSREIKVKLKDRNRLRDQDQESMS